MVIFTDGACSGNPGPAGLGVYCPETDYERSEYLGNATNNIAELLAISRAIDLIETRLERSVIFTDSIYAIGVLTKDWRVKANLELVRQITNQLERVARRIECVDYAIDLKHVRGHRGNPGNEKADELATRAVRTQTTEISS